MRTGSTIALAAGLTVLAAAGATLYKLHPPAPLSLLALARAAGTDPADLIPTLGLTVARSRDAVMPSR